MSKSVFNRLTLAEREKLISLKAEDFHAIDYDFIAINIPTQAGATGDFTVPDKNILDKDALIIGFNVRRQNDAGTKFCEDGNKLVSPAVHDSSFFYLKDKYKRDVLENMPFELLEPRQADNPMHRYFLDFIDLANSKFVCKNAAELQDDESYELCVYYINFDKLQLLLNPASC